MSGLHLRVFDSESPGEEKRSCLLRGMDWKRESSVRARGRVLQKRRSASKNQALREDAPETVRPEW